MSAVLEVRGVTKSYGEHEVLRGIDLTVGEHEAVALIGASGSGKSTLLRCIDLLEEIDDGDIFLDGEAITVPGMDPVPIRRRLGLVFQAFNLFPHMKVIDNVVLGAVRAQGMAQAQAREAGHGAAGALRARRPRATRTRTSSPAGSSSGWRSPARWSTQPAGAAARRGDERARSRARRRGPRGHPRAQGARA